MFPEELVRKSWTESGYPPKDMLGTTNETTIVIYIPEQTITLEGETCGPNSHTNFDIIEFDADPQFTKSNDASVDEVELNFD